MAENVPPTVENTAPSPPMAVHPPDNIPAPNTKLPPTAPAHHWSGLAWTGGVVILLIAALAVWHKPVAHFWDSLGGRTSPSSATTTKTASLTDTTPSTLDTKSTSSTDHQTTSSTTTSSTNTTNQGAGNNGSGGTSVTATTPAGSVGTTTDLSNLYNNIAPGLTEGQLTSLAGISPSACTQVPATNDTVCTWSQNGRSVVVTLQNGSVVGTPVKVGF